MRFLKHPFPVRTVFRHCVLVNFGVEPDVLASALPEPLKPAVAHDRAWLSIVIAEMKKMRPAFVPSPLGITYNQIVYRAVVECDGKRGVHFLRSDANSRLMSGFGNAMSFFRFHYGRVDINATATSLRVEAFSRDHPPVHVRAEFDVTSTRTEISPGARSLTSTTRNAG